MTRICSVLGVVAAAVALLAACGDAAERARSDAAEFEAKAQKAEREQRNGESARHPRALPAPLDRGSPARRPTPEEDIAALTAENAAAAKALREQTARNAELRRLIDETDRRLAEEKARIDRDPPQPPAAPPAPRLPDDPTARGGPAHVPRPPAVPPPPAGPRPEVRGVVQAASAKDDVYVLSVGSRDGVCVGDRFTVTRGQDAVCELTIDSVFPSHAAGHRTDASRTSAPKAGDAVTRPAVR